MSQLEFTLIIIIWQASHSVRIKKKTKFSAASCLMNYKLVSQSNEPCRFSGTSLVWPRCDCVWEWRGGIGCSHILLATPNINFMHVLEALGSQYPIKGHLADPSGPILSTALTAVDPMAASMTTGHY